MQIKETVGKMPVLSVILYIILQAVQIIVAIIPGGPMQLLGGMLFGKLFGFLFCMLGTLLGTVTVYYLVKLIGSPLVEAFVAKKNFKTLKILENQRRLEILVFVMFLLPGIPKDALTYLVPLTKLPAERFFVISTVARAPAIFMSIMVGDSLSKGNFLQSVIFFLVLVAVATVGVLYKDKVIGIFKNQKEVPGLSIKHNITYKDEWLAEAYMETDYSTLSSLDFQQKIREYIAFKLLNNIVLKQENLQKKKYKRV